MSAIHDGVPDSTPPESVDVAQEVIRQGFAGLSQVASDIEKSIAAFNRQQKETRERIDRGPRRTDGRIV
jgi:hypothetical protein